MLQLFYMILRKRQFPKLEQIPRRRKSLGLTMTVKLIFKREDKLYDESNTCQMHQNLELVRVFRDWKRKP